MITYRKTRTDQWVAYGPAEEVKLGVATITRKDGKTSLREVISLGKTFNVDGIAHRYGYLDPEPIIRHQQQLAPRTTSTYTPQHTSHTCEECGSHRAHMVEDMSGIIGWLCNRCDNGYASFA